MYLKRPEREVKPWYTDRELKRVEDKATDEQAEERRARDRYVISSVYTICPGPSCLLL
jgi:hypothetical protein